MHLQRFSILKTVKDGIITHLLTLHSNIFHCCGIITSCPKRFIPFTLLFRMPRIYNEIHKNFHSLIMEPVINKRKDSIKQSVTESVTQSTFSNTVKYFYRQNAITTHPNKNFWYFLFHIIVIHLSF